MSGATRSVACTFCKKRKRKCDGQNPCSICQKYNKNGDCEYLVDQDKRKFKYDSTYIDYLEMKVDLLEQLANGLIRSNPEKAYSIDKEIFQQRSSTFNNEYTDGSNSSTGSHTHKAVTSQTLLNDLANEKAVQELISTKWKVRQDNRGYTEFYGPVSGRQGTVEDVEKEEYPSNIETNLEVVLANDELRLSLIDNFLKHFGNYFYISKLVIDEVKTWEFSAQDISKQLLMLAIFTFGSVFEDGHRYLSVTFLQRAEALTVKACQRSDEYIVQALLILSCYDLGMGLDSNSWIFDAMCSSMTQSLKLDRQVVKQSELTSDTIPYSKRSSVLFWSVILQDRIITSVLGRGCRLQYFRIKTDFLSKTTDVDASVTDLSELTFSYHAQLWFIHDKYLSQIYSFKADHLHNSHRLALMNQGADSLNVFYENLPSIMKFDDSITDTRLIIFHLSYSVAILLLHRAYLRQMPLKVIQITIMHCEKAGKLVEKLRDNLQSDAPHFISYLILTCATFDLFLMSNKDESLHEKSLKRINIYVATLLNFGKYWKRCLKDVQILTELAKRWNLKVPILEQSSTIYPLEVSPPNLNSYDYLDYRLSDVNADEFFRHLAPTSEVPNF